MKSDRRRSVVEVDAARRPAARRPPAEVRDRRRRPVIRKPCARRATSRADAARAQRCRASCRTSPRPGTAPAPTCRRGAWAWACGSFRATARRSAIVCSAAAIVLPPGVFMQTMPRRVAASTSTLSRPTPARPITSRAGAAPITSAVTRVALRTIEAVRRGRSAGRAPRAAGSGPRRPGGPRREGCRPDLLEGVGDENPRRPGRSRQGQPSFAKIRCAAATAAPSSTGTPSRTRTRSSDARPTIRSDSST